MLSSLPTCMMQQAVLFQTFEGRTIAMARTLTCQVRHSVTVITGYLPENYQPEAVRERLVHARQFSEELYKSFKEVSYCDCNSFCDCNLRYWRWNNEVSLSKGFKSSILLSVWKCSKRPSTDSIRPITVQFCLFFNFKNVLAKSYILPIAYYFSPLALFVIGTLMTTFKRTCNSVFAGTSLYLVNCQN